MSALMLLTLGVALAIVFLVWVCRSYRDDMEYSRKNPNHPGPR